MKTGSTLHMLKVKKNTLGAIPLILLFMPTNTEHLLVTLVISPMRDTPPMRKYPAFRHPYPAFIPPLVDSKIH